MTGTDHSEEYLQLQKAIQSLESQRDILGEAIVEAALGPMQKQLSEMDGSHDPPFEGVRKLATVLFADFSGFTTLMEEKDPEDVREMINACFKRFVPIIKRNEGTIEKFIGDEIMAIFGAPIAHENDPELAIRTALEMMDELEVFNSDYRTNLKIHVGINTGLVIAGVIGSEDQQQYGVMGDTVNLAKRLESASPAGGILISHATYSHVRGIFNVVSQEPIQVKGKAKPVNTYLVESIKPRAFRTEVRGVEGIETRMVGRDAELLTLQNIFHDVMEDAETHIVTLVGEAGIGKSRLLYEFVKWIELLPDDIWYFKGWASAGMEAEPFGVIRRMFAYRFDIHKSDSREIVRDKIRAGMAATLNPDQADLVGHLMGFDLPMNKEIKIILESDHFRDEALSNLVKYLEVLTVEPTVIILEDIHWSDDSSLDLIDHLAAKLPDSRLMIICLARPTINERRPRWGEGMKARQCLELKALSRRKSRALVNEILQKVNKVPDKLQNLIVDGAEGNPFYVEELIKMFIDDDIIQGSEENWIVELDRLSESRVPSTLAGVIQARLDSLPAEERNLLQRASVVGRLFWDMAVAELALDNSDKIAKDELDPLLESVRSRELVLRREQSTFAETEEYIFKHTLLRDVTYETVLLKMRKVYHRQVAVWLEAAAGDRIGEYLGLIAGHYEMAGDQSRAVEYLLRTGDRARMAGALQEATESYQRALIIQKGLDKFGQAARTLMKLGLVYHTDFDFARSRQAFEEGFGLWQQAEEIDQQTISSPATYQPLRLIRGAPYSLDPTMTDHTDSSVVMIQLFSGLVEGGTAMEVVPDISRSWNISDGGRIYQFKLRDDVLWSDGRPVTAKDFEYSWLRTLDPANGSPNASLFFDIKGAKEFHAGEHADAGKVGIRMIDDQTLEVELEGPTGYFLSLLACSATYPVPRHVVEAHGESWTELKNFVSNGAFILEEWEKGEKMILTRNPAYHGRFRGNLQQLDLSLNIDKNISLEYYREDKLDVLSLENILHSEWDLARRFHAGDYVSTPEAITNYVGFDVSQPPFDDPRVRRAFALATDKTVIANVVLGGYFFPAAGGFIPPGVPGHSPDIGLEYKPEHAKMLMAEAGYPAGAGFPQVIACARERIRPQTENLAVQWLDTLGVEISWEFLPWMEYLERLDNTDVHIFQFGWMADYPDPDSFLRTGNIQQRTRWSNATYVELVNKARRVLDQEERLGIYHKADKILIESAAVIPITYSLSHTLVKPWVRKFPAAALNQWLWKEIIVEPHL